MSDETRCNIIGGLSCLWSFFSVRGEMWFIVGMVLLCTSTILARCR